jgi:hypothetical protein
MQMHVSVKFIWVILSIASFLAPVIQWIDSHVWADWPFTVALIIVVMIDFVLGTTEAVMNRRFVYGIKDGVGKTLLKFIVYFGVLIVSHQLTTYKVDGNDNMIFGSWVNAFWYGVIMLNEASSVYRNAVLLGVIRGKWVILFFKRFAEGQQIMKDIEESEAPEETKKPS